MDALGLSIFNDIYNRFITKVNAMVQHTNINCNINVGSIETTNINNCNILLSNTCISNETSTFTLLLQSIADVIRLLPEERRKIIENALGVTVDDIDLNNDVGFIYSCRNEALLNSNINIESIILRNCSSTTPIDMIFSNTGSVESNCGLRYVNEALINKNKETINYDLKYIFRLGLMEYIIIILLIFFTYIIYLMINFYIYNKSKSLYYSRNTVLNNDDNILTNIYIRHNNGKRNFY
ncbi:S-S bond formation pathway protein [Alphaentomopoxvirus acuprea]|uniref:S-S bond formation pathway protein n=1 Tax=Alphaentomopoxvirus acuprea TaxID=62099 RepID=W6JIZ0_9POXV|nr:S-S bond formation pathway protein [Anomala cuprea entomopoxvirus]BAO49578.1 S-S bond formation pathway protein [Anomala cuprea entomopoxvirus]